MTETDIQNAIRCELSKYGVVVRMNTGFFQTFDGRVIKCGIKGMSDLLFIGQGYVAFIEVKTPTGRLRPEQKNFLARMKSMGHIAGVARSVDEAVKLIESGRN